MDVFPRYLAEEQPAPAHPPENKERARREEKKVGNRVGICFIGALSVERSWSLFFISWCTLYSRVVRFLLKGRVCM